MKEEAVERSRFVVDWTKWESESDSLSEASEKTEMESVERFRVARRERTSGVRELLKMW